MNKKAIAAFAAGATLLAGFAMATPAFAAEGTDAKTADTKVDPAKLKEAKDKVVKAEREVTKDTVALEEAQEAANNAEVVLANVKAAKDAADKAKAEQDKTTAADTKDNYSANQKKKIDEAKDAADKALQEALKKAKEDLNSSTDFADYDAVNTKVSGIKSAVFSVKVTLEEAKATLTEAKAALAKLEGKKVTPKKDDKNTPVNPPVQTADPSKSAASAELMRTQVVLAEADATNKDAQEKFVKSKADFEAAKTQMAAFDAQVKSAADREEALRVAGKTDTDAYKAAVIDLKAAQSRANAYRTHEYADAEKNFVEKSGKALLAATAYNAALVNYRAAYNKAVEVEASAVKGFADPNTLNPVSTDFPAAPAAAKAEAKKVEAKAEAKAQAAAPAAAAGKAGAVAAKGELAGMGTKGGNGHKAGEKLGNAGVGVALTALAASMLAGMGAAVRKMRH